MDLLKNLKEEIEELRRQVNETQEKLENSPDLFETKSNEKNKKK